MRMNWQPFKERYERFKRWQREPMRYVQGEVEHRCNNCGFTFTGHYCPTCSQRASLGRIGWQSVRQSVMDMWGLGSRSRSVLYSVWQLLFLPGYFIIGYKQLFGYDLWGTVWRLLFVFSFVYCITLLLANLVFFSGQDSEIQVAGHSFPAKNFMTCFYTFFGVLIMSSGYLINHIATRKARRGQKP